MSGGAGVDAASYEDAAQAVEINLVTAIFTADAAGDSFVSVERLVLSGFDDAVTLAGAIRYVDGGAAGDVLSGDEFDLVLTAFDDDIDLNGIQSLGIGATTGDGNDRIIMLSQMGDFVMGKGSDTVIGIAGSSTIDLGGVMILSASAVSGPLMAFRGGGGRRCFGLSI